ncbi:OLC1v1009169C1 [Oldenlandia corymbosa var. corymbosa]|uniref:sarcosine oxidasee (formaldehyde-forming) n=1 Tax=Oldenlandia corymbosa var. corymbosa TaxID=529605 RepID=A0AAV1DNJ3_OLDCO|nr:OLC1v1009169C1 [Oldenlandia corymbosa var. corymbosa]
MADYDDFTYDVIVVGAGVMGSSTAYQIAKRGQKVLLLEQFDFLHHRGSSHGESRTTRVTYPEDYYPKMVLHSEKLWQEAESEVGYKVYFKTPQFDMGPKDSKSLQAVISSCRKNSIPFRILDHDDEVKGFCGKFHLGDHEDWIGVVNEHGGVIKPTKAVSMFQTLAFKHGARMKDNTEVSDIKRDDSNNGIVVITKEKQRFWCSKCVVTAGAWMQKLVQKVSDLTLPIQPLQTAVHYWKIKEGYEDDFKIENGFPTFASYGEPYIYGTPSLEFPGLIKVAVHGGNPCDPDKRTWTNGGGGAASVPLNSLREWVRSKFGDVVDAVNGPVMAQSCMYSMTPDEDLIIDFLGAEFGNDVVVAGGFSGHGFKMAPIIGKVLSQLAIDGQLLEDINSIVELKYFRIQRFEENPKGNLKEFEDQVGR